MALSAREALLRREWMPREGAGLAMRVTRGTIDATTAPTRLLFVPSDARPSGDELVDHRRKLVL